MRFPLENETQDITVTFSPPQVGNYDSQIVLAGDVYGNAVVSISAVAVNNIEGSLSGTINSEFSPYEISGDIFVESGNTLNITAGTEFHFMGDYSFEINGLLVAEGKPDSLIKFIGDNDLNWKGIRINSPNNVMSYCLIEDVGNYATLPMYSINFENNYGNVEVSHNVLDLVTNCMV